MIKYASPSINDDDINDLVKVLRSGNITQSEIVLNFEEEIKKFDNYKLNQLEKFICKYNKNTQQVNRINDNVNLIQILGNKFEKKEFSPVINQDTGFNLSILKSSKGHITNLKFEKPTIMFSRTGKWEIMIDDFQCVLNAKDTISIPINSKVNIKIDENEDCYLNCVTQI